MTCVSRRMNSNHSACRKVDVKSQITGKLRDVEHFVSVTWLFLTLLTACITFEFVY